VLEGGDVNKKVVEKCHIPYPWKMRSTYIWVCHENAVGRASNYVKAPNYLR